MHNRYALIGPAILLLVWYLATESGFVNPLFLPKVGNTLMKMAFLLKGKEIWLDMGLTLYRVISGLLIASIIGIPLGILLGMFSRLYAAFEVVIDFFRSLPSTALFPLFLLIFGIGDTAKIAISTFVCLWIILINTASGVIHSSKIRSRVIKTFGANIWQTISNVTILEALPQIAVGLRVALSISFIVVIITEMFIGTTIGLGRRIYDSYLTYKVNEMYATLIIAGMLAYFLNKFFVSIETKYIHWTGK